jgi:hypothetical protein
VCPLGVYYRSIFGTHNYAKTAREVSDIYIKRKKQKERGALHICFMNLSPNYFLSPRFPDETSQAYLRHNVSEVPVYD